MKTASLVVAAGLVVQSVVFAASLPQERPCEGRDDADGRARGQGRLSGVGEERRAFKAT